MIEILNILDIGKRRSKLWEISHYMVEKEFVVLTDHKEDQIVQKRAGPKFDQIASQMLG